MIVIWKRWGILAFIFALLGIWLGATLLTSATGNMGVGIGIGLVLAGVVTFAFDYFALANGLDKPKPLTGKRQLEQPIVGADGTQQWFVDESIINPQTGQPQMSKRAPSSLFFIPMSIWAYILVALGIVLVVVALIA